MIKIDARKLDYKILNSRIHSAISAGPRALTLAGVNGQRYIASGLEADVKIKISGIPGNDMGAFMNGPRIFVDGNAQDAVGNTMSGGSIIVNGLAGDAAGYSMRGGKIIIKDDVGYRAGIHMKQYRDNIPVIIIGRAAKDFLGEYMAGGNIIVLARGAKKACGAYAGTGMHGGAIYLPASKMPDRLPAGLRIEPVRNIIDTGIIDTASADYSRAFKISAKTVPSAKNTAFVKLSPASHRPYGGLYAY